jgi:undecaprenyl-diphosphatase
VAEAPEHPLAEAAVEALGGTPPSLERPPVSPLRPLLPEGLARAIGAFDAGAERGFDRLRGRPAADRLFFAASALGDFSLLWHLVAAGRAVAQPGFRPAARRLVVALAVESLVVNWGVKSLVRRARPTGHHLRLHRLRRPRTSSFPSGHATSGFLAATLLSGGSRAGLGWYGVAAVVAASRVHVRIHHASDVVAGAAMGLVAGRLVRRRWRLPSEQERVPA